MKTGKKPGSEGSKAAPAGLWRRTSLRTRIMVLLVGVALTVSLLALFLGALSVGQTLKSELTRYSATTAQLLNPEFRAILDEGPERAVAIHTRLRAFEPLQQAALYGPDRSVLMHYQRSSDIPVPPIQKAGTVVDMGDALLCYHAVINDAGRQATVVFRLHRRGIWELAQEHLKTTWPLIPLLLVISVLIAFALERLITNPLRKLARSVADLKPGEEPRRLNPDSTEELGTVASGINRMLDSIQSGQRRLLDQKYALDQAAIVSEADAQGLITYVNRHFCDVTGFKRSELINHTYARLRSSIHDDHYFSLLWNELLAGQTWKGEICNQDKSGQLFWLDTTIVPLGKAGEPASYLSIQFDITARKQAETALLDAVDQAQAADRAKTRFVANLSHQVRTPLNGLVGVLQMMRRSDLDETHKRAVNVALRASRDLVQLIRDMLDYAMVEQDKMELDSIRFNLRRMLNEVSGLFEEPAKAKGIKLHIAVDSDVPDVMIGDPIRLRQVLTNLADNAVKFSGQDDDVTLSVRRDPRENAYRFSVEDTGIGLPQGAEEHIFQFFTQLDARTTRSPGSVGLGLALAKGLVERMGGTIGVEARADKGSAFWFCLNLETVDPEYGGVPAKKPSHPTFPAAHALLVEDNEINRIVAIGMLRKLGMEVDVATNGREGVEAIEKKNYEVIIMDCQMPVMDGFSATRAIRNLAAQQALRTPIIAVTAYAMKGDKERAFDAGMDDYITKPLELDVLAKTCARWLPDYAQADGMDTNLSADDLPMLDGQSKA